MRNKSVGREGKLGKKKKKKKKKNDMKEGSNEGMIHGSRDGQQMSGQGGDRKIGGRKKGKKSDIRATQNFQ